MKGKKNKLLFLVVAAVFVAGVYLFTPVQVVSISNRKNASEKYYYYKPFAGDCDGFIISYTHSVNKGRVHDYYRWNKDEKVLVLSDTHFVSYGAGIPEPGETPGAQFYVIDNGYVIKNINRKMKKLVMAVGIIADHSIAPVYPPGNYGYVFDERFFTERFAPQTSLIIEVKKVPYIIYKIYKF